MKINGFLLGCIVLLNCSLFSCSNDNDPDKIPDPDPVFPSGITSNYNLYDNSFLLAYLDDLGYANWGLMFVWDTEWSSNPSGLGSITAGQHGGALDEKGNGYMFESKIASFGPVESLDDIKFMPNSEWTYSQDCVIGNGYIVRFKCTGKANSKNEMIEEIDGTEYYIRLFVKDKEYVSEMNTSRLVIDCEFPYYPEEI